MYRATHTPYVRPRWLSDKLQMDFPLPPFTSLPGPTHAGGEGTGGGGVMVSFFGGHPPLLYL